MDKKKAKEQKRAEKKKLARKAAAGDPWKQIPVDPAQFTCVAVGTFEVEGQVSLHVLRRLPDGRHVLANFIVDRGVTGLKDAYGYADSSRSELEDILRQARADGLKSYSVPLDDARRLVAAGARYADEYGFRLPKDWLRWAGVLGEVGDWRQADTSAFRPEYAESIAYAGRLVRTSPEAFFDRADIYFELPPGESLPTRPRDTATTRPTADWVEPTPDAYRQVYAEAARRSPAAISRARTDLAALGLTPGDHFEDDATAMAAAGLCVAYFGPPPDPLLAPDAGLGNADAVYYFRRLLAEVLGRPVLDASAQDLIRATGAAIGRAQTWRPPANF